MEYIVCETTSQSVVILWTNTSSVNTQKVTKMMIQVNGLFIGQVDVKDKGVKISELEPNEDYDIRIWCQIRNSKFYPSKKIKISTSSYKKDIEDDVLSSATTQVYSEREGLSYEINSIPESLKTREHETISKKDSRLKLIRLQVESLQNIYMSVQKSYNDKKSEYLNSINKAKALYESLNLERPTLLRNLKTLEGNKKIILNQKSKIEKELLLEKRRLEKVKQDLLLKKQLKSDLNSDIKIISLNISNLKKKHCESVDRLASIKEEYISEVKDLEEALDKRKQHLAGLEDRISVIRERISFMKHLLGQLCRLKMKSRDVYGVKQDLSLEDRNVSSDDSADETQVARAWVDLLTD